MDNKVTITNQNCTALVPISEKEKLTINKPIKIPSPVFILFAEYYGYVSPLLEWAEEIVSGKSVDPIKEKLIMLDAKIILDKMKKTENIKEVRETYIALYDIVFSKYDEFLESFDYSSDLPF